MSILLLRAEIIGLRCYLFFMILFCFLRINCQLLKERTFQRRWNRVKRTGISDPYFSGNNPVHLLGRSLSRLKISIFISGRLLEIDIFSTRIAFCFCLIPFHLSFHKKIAYHSLSIDFKINMTMRYDLFVPLVHKYIHIRVYNKYTLRKLNIYFLNLFFFFFFSKENNHW